MQQKQEVPTIEQLEQQLIQLTLQRSQAKDQVEQIERVMPVVQAQLQLLRTQAEARKAEVVED